MAGGGRAGGRTLVLSDGRLAGAILVGYPRREASAVVTALRKRRHLGDVVEDLRAGRWEAVVENDAAVAA